MKEFITSLILSFFIAETAQAIVLKYSDSKQLKSELEILKNDLD